MTQTNIEYSGFEKKLHRQIVAGDVLFFCFVIPLTDNLTEAFNAVGSNAKWWIRPEIVSPPLDVAGLCWSPHVFVPLRAVRTQQHSGIRRFATVLSSSYRDTVRGLVFYIETVEFGLCVTENFYTFYVVV